MSERQDDRAVEELQQLRAAMDASPDGFYLVDMEELRFLYVNERACQLEGLTLPEHLERTPWDTERISREQLEAIYAQARTRPGEPVTSEIFAERDGRRGWFEVQRRALLVEGRWLLVAVSREVSQRKQAEQTALRLGRMYAALGATNEAILRSRSPDELYQRVCDAAVHGGGMVSAAVLLPAGAGTVTVAASAGTGEEFLRELRVSLEGGTPEGEGLVGTAFRSQEPSLSNDFLADQRTRPWHALARDAGIRAAAAVPLLRAGRVRGVMLLHAGQRDAFDPEIVGLLRRAADNVAFGLDNFDHEIERTRAEEDLQHLATHDSLTGLANRAMFHRLIALEIQSARRYGTPFAVLFIDLDRFKFVNDTLGHDAGDELLREMAGRLTAVLRASDVVARLGGDEFVVLVRDAVSTARVAVVARKILSAVIKPLEIAGQECRVTASIGIGVYPGDAEDETALLKNADLAMYQAKESGKNNYQFYSADIQARSLEKMAMETRLANALRRDEFSLQYLAKLDLHTGRITGVEALLRWNNPELGSVPPVQFLPVAEEAGLIVPIGRWVLATACAQNVAWQQAGLPPVCVAVNLSPRQFGDPGLVDDVAATLRATGMAAGHLELEISESMVMQDPNRSVKILTTIKALGVRLAIDDFGTAYSSLAQLSRFPIDTIKVDRSFIRELPDDAEDKATTEAIIAMGRSLSLTVVAEGVETEEQQTYLRAHACNEIQGFYFSKPVAPEAFADLLRSHPGEKGTGSAP